MDFLLSWTSAPVPQCPQRCRPSTRLGATSSEHEGTAAPSRPASAPVTQETHAGRSQHKNALSPGPITHKFTSQSLNFNPSLPGENTRTPTGRTPRQAADRGGKPARSPQRLHLLPLAAALNLWRHRHPPGAGLREQRHHAPNARVGRTNPTQAPYRSPAYRSPRSALSRRSTHAPTAWGGVEGEKEDEGKREEPKPRPRRGSGLRLLSFFLLLLLADPRLPPAAALRPPPVQRAARLPPAPLPRRPGQLREQRRREAAAALRPAVPWPFPSRQRPAAFSDTRRRASGRRRHLVGGRGAGGGAGSEAGSEGVSLGPGGGSACPRRHNGERGAGGGRAVTQGFACGSGPGPPPGVGLRAGRPRGSRAPVPLGRGESG